MKFQILEPGSVRFFLALTVVVHHSTRLGLGTWAVFVFFILSGYWITRMWDQSYSKSSRPYLNFIMSRYFRLAPTLVLCIMILISAVIFLDNNTSWMEAKNVVSDPVWILRSVGILSSASQATFLSPKWSIDTEMQFYLVAGALFFVVSKKALPRILLCVALSGVVFFCVAVGNYDYPAKTLIPYISLFAAGSIIYAFEVVVPKYLANASALLFVSVCVALVIHPVYRYVLIGGPNVVDNIHAFNESFSFFGALLVTPYLARSLSVKSSIIDRHLGNLAYPIYLFHMTPILLYRAYFGDYDLIDRIPFLLLTYLVVLVGSILIYVGFDRPIDSVRRRYFL